MNKLKRLVRAIRDYYVIKNSGLFDANYYLTNNTDVRHADINPLKHYVKHGALEGRNPSTEFDVFFYANTYDDVRGNCVNSLAHYILYGKKEGRLTKGDKNKALQDNPQINQELSALCGLTNSDNNRKNMLNELRKRNELSVLPVEEKEYFFLKEKSIDWSKYFENNEHIFKSTDPVLDYIRSWLKFKPTIPGFFDTEFYLDSYPDIKKSGVNPLMHFIKNGRSEGRLGIFDQSKVSKGGLDFDLQKETIVFVSHESSATGAPLLGYNIVDGLSKWYNVVHLVIKKANISDIIPKNCFLYTEDISDNKETNSAAILKALSQKYGIKAVILNSVETLPVLHMAAKLKLPTVSLIHEFSDYTKPVGKMVNTLFHATEVITPASIIKNSMLSELKMLSGIDTPVNHISQLPQGKLPYLPDTFGDEDTAIDLYKKLKIINKNNTKIIVGSGYVQVRKGVDLFLSVARYIKENFKGNCKFIWVGDGYNPEHDFACSVWLKRDIQFYGLEDDFIFLEHQKSLDTVFSIADVFCLTSRMDPFPNAAIDAMEANLPIACFKDASGTEEFVQENNADYLLANYLDSHQMAEKIVTYFEKGSRKQTINAQLVKEKLSFDHYMNAINELINKAEKTVQSTNRAVNKILKNNMFDASYYGLDQDPELAAYYYVSLYKKGLHKMSPNPMPGFSQLQWTLNHGWCTTSTPLEQAIDKGIKQTQECKILPLSKQDIKPIKFKYAVHLHLYYIDLAENFVMYFKNLMGEYHLYITIIKPEDSETVYKAFNDCGASYIEVVVVENIGRDIGPMIFNLRKQLTTNGYEVIGHFHSKKSLSTDSDLGNRWREYLMQNLVGGNGVSESLLSLFNDPEVGLVFADDKHIVDIGDNQQYVDDLCQMLDLPKITNTHVFPLGNMFWARIDAIKQFFELDPKTLLQPEPLPYDGSYMHAIERVSPNLVQKNGYRYLTVYKNGTTW